MIYLDNAATGGKKPKCVYDNISWGLEYLANPTRSSHKLAMQVSEKVFETRVILSKMFNQNDPSKVIFTKNCTESLNDAIFGTVKMNGHVITSELEHNSMLRPLFSLKKKGLIELTVLPPNDLGVIAIEQVEKAIRKNTYLVALTHLSNVTGTKNDIESIENYLKNSDILFIVDGAQSGGYYDIDMQKMNIDILCLPAHKGLNSPTGLGFMLIKGDVDISPILLGGTGVNGLDTIQPVIFPEGFESGTLPTLSILGALGGVNYTYSNRFKIQEKMNKFEEMLYSATLPNNILVKSKSNCAGIFTFEIENFDSGEVAQILSEDYDIAIRSGYFCAPLIHKSLNSIEKGLIRASFSSFNTFMECELFLQAIKRIAIDI